MSRDRYEVFRVWVAGGWSIRIAVDLERASAQVYDASGSWDGTSWIDTHDGSPPARGRESWTTTGIQTADGRHDIERIAALVLLGSEAWGEPVREQVDELIEAGEIDAELDEVEQVEALIERVEVEDEDEDEEDSDE